MKRFFIVCLVLASAGVAEARTAEELESIVQAKPNFVDTLWGHLLRFFPDSVERARVVAFPFLDKAGQRISTGGTWISEYLVYLLRESGRFEVVPRRDFRRALRRIDLSPKDPVDDSTAAYIARQLDAPYVLTGRVAPMSGRYDVTGNLKDAGTGIIVTGATVPATGRAMEELEELLLKRKQLGTIRPALLRSMLIPGWGQFYRDRTVMGWVSLGTCLPMLGVTAYYGFGPFREAVVEWYDFQNYIDNSDAVRDTIAYLQENCDRSEQCDTLTKQDILKNIERKLGDPLDERLVERSAKLGLLAVATGGLWLANMVDVIIAGRSLDRKYRLFFTGDFVNEAGVIVCVRF